MDNEVKAVLTHYDQRAAKELALMQELSPDEMMRRVDEFLISIGHTVFLAEVARANKTDIPP